jgi:hypothetical protein
MKQLTVRPQDKLVLVVLSCSFSWGTKTDKQMSEAATEETGATTGAVRVRKTLFPAASGKHIKAVQSSLSAFYSNVHMQHTFGVGMKGQRAMPSAFYMKYMEKFGETQAHADAALDELEAGYPQAIKDAKALLGTAFKVDDYPPVDEIREYFTFDVKFLPMPAGDHIMNALGAAVASDVNEHVDKMLQAAADDAMDRLRKAVERMATTLTKGGKIYDTMPEQVNQLVELLPEIAGITDDKQLQSAIHMVKHTLTGWDGDDFRKMDDAEKTSVGKAAMDMLRKMGG